VWLIQKWTSDIPQKYWTPYPHKHAFMCQYRAGANRLVGVDVSTRLCMTFACVTYLCDVVKTERWGQLIFASHKYELSPPFGFDNVTQVNTRANVIHSLVEVSTPTSRFAPVISNAQRDCCSQLCNCSILFTCLPDVCVVCCAVCQDFYWAH